MSQPQHPTLNQDSFNQLVEAHRHELHRHCYRMMGTLDDAEDALQEAFLRAWRGRDTYAGRAPVRAWLYKIATNTCLDALKKQPKRFIPKTHQPASSASDPIPPAIHDPIWLDPYPDELYLSDEKNPEEVVIQREHISMAFITALHVLPPRQRAVLILCDVLDWKAQEAADVLNTTVLAVKSALHRARVTLNQAEYQKNVPPDTIEHTFLQAYIHAWQMADVEGLIGLLTEDAIFSMPPIPSWYRGRDAIRQLIAKTIFSGQAHGRWRLSAVRANGQIAFGLYRYDEEKQGHVAYGIQLITMNGDKISDIITFRHPTLIAKFGLPHSI
jgi:RNA polymerase sigma-70 factor, ECF subfamily